RGGGRVWSSISTGFGWSSVSSSSGQVVPLSSGRGGGLVVGRARNSSYTASQPAKVRQEALPVSGRSSASTVARILTLSNREGAIWLASVWARIRRYSLRASASSRGTSSSSNRVGRIASWASWTEPTGGAAGFPLPAAARAGPAALVSLVSLVGIAVAPR